MNWAELRTEFEALREALCFYRLDYQWGAAGTYYRLAGGGRSHAIRRFEVLSEIAGRKLQELPPESLNSGVLAAPNAISRWYESLRYHSGAFETGTVGMQRDDAGNDMGGIYTGGVSLPAESSAVVCLQFSALSRAEPTFTTTKSHSLLARINGFLKQEAEHRGYFWLIVGFVITVALATLAL